MGARTGGLAGQTPLAAFLTWLPTLAPQGLFVLLFHCVLNREVRKHLKGALSGKKPHPDDSATTRATLLTVGTPGPPAGLGPLPGGLRGGPDPAGDAAPSCLRP